jgi:hypothetical protein
VLAGNELPLGVQSDRLSPRYLKRHRSRAHRLADGPSWLRVPPRRGGWTAASRRLPSLNLDGSTRIPRWERAPIHARHTDGVTAVAARGRRWRRTHWASRIAFVASRSSSAPAIMHASSGVRPGTGRSGVYPWNASGLSSYGSTIVTQHGRRWQSSCRCRHRRSRAMRTTARADGSLLSPHSGSSSLSLLIGSRLRS